MEPCGTAMLIVASVLEYQAGLAGTICLVTNYTLLYTILSGQLLLLIPTYPSQHNHCSWPAWLPTNTHTYTQYYFLMYNIICSYPSSIHLLTYIPPTIFLYYLLYLCIYLCTYVCMYEHHAYICIYMLYKYTYMYIYNIQSYCITVNTVHNMHTILAAR